VRKEGEKPHTLPAYQRERMISDASEIIKKGVDKEPSSRSSGEKMKSWTTSSRQEKEGEEGKRLADELLERGRSTVLCIAEREKSKERPTF